MTVRNVIIVSGVFGLFYGATRVELFGVVAMGLSFYGLMLIENKQE